MRACGFAFGPLRGVRKIFGRTPDGLQIGPRRHKYAGIQTFRIMAHEKAFFHFGRADRAALDVTRPSESVERSVVGGLDQRKHAGRAARRIPRNCCMKVMLEQPLASICGRRVGTVDVNILVQKFDVPPVVKRYGRSVREPADASGLAVDDHTQAFIASIECVVDIYFGHPRSRKSRHLESFLSPEFANLESLGRRAVWLRYERCGHPHHSEGVVWQRAIAGGVDDTMGGAPKAMMPEISQNAVHASLQERREQLQLLVDHPQRSTAHTDIA